jgi:hypothetical protein
MKPHIYIATPILNDNVRFNYAYALAETTAMLRGMGMQITTDILVGGSLLVKTRNQLVKRFMASDATHMLCIDSDLAWPPEAIIAMLKEDKDAICGVYPVRQGKSESGNNRFIFRPEYDSRGGIVCEKHLMKLESAPAGFLLLKRETIQKMMDFHPDCYCKPKFREIEQEDCFYFFNTEVYENEFWGEDYVFCRRLKEAGLELWVDPLITFDHAGVVGQLTECLIQKVSEEVDEVQDVEVKPTKPELELIRDVA